MIIVNAEAVEATAATLSAAEALEILAPAQNAITNEEAASLRQIVAAVATRDPRRRKDWRPSRRRRRRPSRTGRRPELKTFLETADLGRYADALVAARLRFCCSSEGHAPRRTEKSEKTRGPVVGFWPSALC